MVDMPLLDNTMINESFIEQSMMTAKDCADQCVAKCITYVRYSNFNSSLWMLFLGMFLITAYYFLNQNESILIEVARRSGQTDTRHIHKTIEWLMFFGISFIIGYMILFIFVTAKINPMG